MKLLRGALVIAVVTLVGLNLHGKVFPAKAMNGYEDSLAIMWEVLDTDKDGGISASEFKAADADSDGSVSLGELIDYTFKYMDDVEADLPQEDTKIEGAYEIYVPESNEDTLAKLELVKDGEGQYSVKMTYEDQSYDGTEVAVSGNEFTFKIEFGYESVEFEQTWKCTVNDGELSVEFTELVTDTSALTAALKGKLLVDDDRQQDDPNIGGTYELYGSHTDSLESNPKFVLTEHGAGEYSAKLTYKDQSVNGTEVAVSGNKCTFKTIAGHEPSMYFLAWECTVDDGELSVAYALHKVEFVPALMFTGKLLTDE